ncbi:WD40-repeat-containing domain protein [Mycena albidolilacea]|uniref:WD40-repeat-containing domain protein n=1 Tax=Mycena albidolilacea TaxID=1033008 RepID=A0AAD7ADH8_9AGAR|nr:WD40-repeat-containing domain protein [Mycena albidolilacea]
MSTVYMVPILSPPTPAASPGPDADSFLPIPVALPQNPALRQQYLASLLHSLSPSELLFVSTTIAPLLKRDFIADLPTEIALMVLSFIDEPRTLARAGRVSRRWKAMVADEAIWRGMCMRIGFNSREPKTMTDSRAKDDQDDEPLEEMEEFASFPMDPPQQWLAARRREAKAPTRPPAASQSPPAFSYYLHFKQSYSTMMNWRYGGSILRAHRMAPTPVPPNGGGALNSIDVITSVALDQDWVVVGLANSKIHVFSSRTGVLARTLVGHDAGVWGVCLVGRGGSWVGERPNTDGGDTVPAMWRTPLGLDLPVGETPPVPFPGKRSSPCSASDGWGQPNSLVVSGGCDKVLRVWDVRSGYPLHVLSGHTSTIRCLKMLHNRPIAVTGSRDSTLRVWDVQRGRMIRSMSGHTGSVRCLDVCGNRAVSGSYDATCRVWNLDSGECIHVLRGHFHQIYSVAFDGVRIASGGLDTTVRVWDALTGHCLALLQGHTALVCQLQLSPSLPFTPHPDPILVTGGSDGRVITFSLSTYTALHRIAAHDSSVTSLQFDARWLVTAGNDGRVRLWEIATGAYVRELSEGGESVWKVCFGGASEDAEMGLGASSSGGSGDVLDGHDGGGDVIAIMCKRAGKSVMEIWSFRPQDKPLSPR